MHFRLQLVKLTEISNEEFEHLYWLLMTYIIKQCVNINVFKYLSDQCPNYLNEIFDIATKTNFH